MQKKTMILAAAATCAVVGVAAWFTLRDQTAVQYRTAAVRRGDINVTISATGNPNAVVTVQVGSQVSGIIQALYADYNTKVARGELIARIDPAPFQARVAQSQANLDAARANVANAETGVQRALAAIEASKSTVAAAAANVARAGIATQDAQVKGDRRVQLAKEGILSQEDVDTALATRDSASADEDAAAAQQRAAEQNVTVAEAELQAARTQLAANQAQVKQFVAALESTQLDLEHTSIKAPVDGVVVSRNVDVGQTVAASLAAPTLFLIAQDLTKMQVDTNVSEADVGRIRVDQPATFSVDAYPGQVFRGTVTSIRKAPINVQNVITYDAVIGVPNPDLKLFPGMTANVKILVNQRRGVLRAPNAALRFRPADVPIPTAATGGAGVNPRGGAPGGNGVKSRNAVPERTVWILDAAGQPKAVVVTTGESDGVNTEITGGGLKEGDRVIVATVASAANATGGSPVSQSGVKTGRGPGF
jgi:HlyD family secretion protein